MSYGFTNPMNVTDIVSRVSPICYRQLMPLEICLQLGITVVSLLQGSYCIFALSLPLAVFNLRTYSRKIAHDSAD